VRYVITDKVHDAWIDDVFYDLAFEAVLSQGTTPGITTTDLPSLAATALGIVAYAEGITHSETDPENHVIAEMRLFATNQADPITLSLTSEMMAATATDRKAARLRWDRPLNIERLEIDLLDSDTALHIQGLTLIDERDGSSVPVLLSGEGRVRLVHSGDVKLYELPDALPRAYVVHKAVAIEDDAAALAALADPGFDPAQQVILHAQLEPDLVSLEELSGLPTAEVTTKINEPERIALEVALPAPGYLVLSDAIYPGWKATVDGVPAEILRANVHFRAVFLNAGTHVVEFTFKSSSYTVGLSISIAAFVAILVALALATRRSRIADV
jgi:hypothetical protein